MPLPYNSENMDCRKFGQWQVDVMVLFMEKVIWVWKNEGEHFGVNCSF